MKKDFLTKKEVSFYAVEAKARLEEALLMKWDDKNPEFDVNAWRSDATNTYIEAMGLKTYVLNCIVDWHNASAEVAVQRENIEAMAGALASKKVNPDDVMIILRGEFGGAWESSEAKKNADKKQRADERREREALLRELEELGDAVGDEAEAKFMKTVEELAGQEM